MSSLAESGRNARNRAWARPANKQRTCRRRRPPRGGLFESFLAMTSNRATGLANPRQCSLQLAPLRRGFSSQAGCLWLCQSMAAFGFGPSLFRHGAGVRYFGIHANMACIGEAAMRVILNDPLLFSCLATFVTGTFYSAFCDPASGSGQDSFTCAVAHKTRDGEIIIDAVREVRPFFSPSAVIAELVVVLKSYRIWQISGDHYAGEFPRELFRQHGISYEVCKWPKSDLYRDLLPLLNSGRIVLPRTERRDQAVRGI